MNDDFTRPVVASADAQSPHESTERLSRIVHEGGRSVPEDNPPLVCKPKKIESWRVFKIMSEFIEGFDIIRKYGLAVTMFGSTRAAPKDESYHEAQELASRLAKNGFAVITGGSSGIMEAANKGAFDAGGVSVGLNIHLPDAQRYNPYLTEKFVFDHFFVRKVMLTYASEIYVYFPGGFGTLDEFFEIITLIQTKKIRRVPIVLIGKKFWEPVRNMLYTTLYKEFKTIDEADLDLFVIVDSVNEAYDYVVQHVQC